MPRVGRKRSDRRWIDPSGEQWASRYEWETYEYLRAGGTDVRRCTEGDTITYREPKRGCVCLECGGGDIVQERRYTPDLFVIPKGKSEADGYYIEVKGYFRGEKRRLFRCLRNDKPDIDIRVVANANPKTGKLRLTEYFARYLKTTPIVITYQNIPEDWK
jgi:hypothetical protein